MKEIRLIKQKDVQKQEAAKVEEDLSAPKRNAIEVVREWVEERKVSKNEQGRKLFASLFAQPQPE
jgi:hypothetical protein